MIKGILLTLSSILLGWTVQVEARMFTDAKGRQIEADLVAHAGEKIVIERAGKKFTLPVTAFSQRDQVYIMAWIAENPDAIDLDYKFRFYADLKVKKGVAQRRGTAYDDRLKFSENLYEMIVYNNGDNEIIDVDIHYQIYVADFVVMKDNRYSRLAYGYRKSETLEVIAGVEKNKTIPVKGRFDFERKFFTESYIDRDYGFTDQTAQDKVIGVRIRVFKGEKLLAEFADEEIDGRVDNIEWQDKEPGKQVRE
jgi:hypothetical protein